MKSKELRAALPRIQLALFNLLNCWDELDRAERLLGVDITLDDLSNLAVDLNAPSEGLRITGEQMKKWMKEYVLNQSTVERKS